jgi:uncharacterized membrane protein
MTKNHPHKRTRQIIRSFEAKALKKRPFSIKIADALTFYFGTIWFLLLNLAIFAFWILVNNNKIPGIPVFDPYPHVLLITAVSLEAIILAVVVLISQNRERQISTLRDELQLQVELISEKEISKVLRLINKLLKKKGIVVTDKELEEMIKEVDTSYIERKLEEQLVAKPTPVAKKVVKGVEKTLSSKK